MLVHPNKRQLKLQCCVSEKNNKKREHKLKGRLVQARSHYLCQVLPPSLAENDNTI